MDNNNFMPNSNMETPIQLAGGGSFYGDIPQQQQSNIQGVCPDCYCETCKECEVCPTNAQGHYRYLREVKAKGFTEKLDTLVTDANVLFGAWNILFGALLIGAVFHAPIIKLFKHKIPKITVGDK